MQYSAASTAISTPYNNGANIQHCNINGGNIGIYLYRGEQEPYANIPATIKFNTILSTANTSVLVDRGASGIVLQDNILDGGDIGMSFVNSSPIRITQNKIYNQQKFGIYIANASPSFIDEGLQTNNCITGNGIGVQVESYSTPVFGLDNIPGYNSINKNISYQFYRLMRDVQAQYNYFRDGNPIPEDFYRWFSRLYGNLH